MFLVGLTYGTVQTSSCTPTQHRTYLNTCFICLEGIMLLNSKHIKEIVLLQNWTSFPHVTVSISSPTKSFFSLLNHCHLLQLGACLCKHGLICFLYAVLLKLKAFIFFFFLLRCLLYTFMLSTLRWWFEMHIPFFWQFNLCNVTQAVVDEILKHILTQVTLNVLNKINTI